MYIATVICLLPMSFALLAVRLPMGSPRNVAGLTYLQIAEECNADNASPLEVAAPLVKSNIGGSEPTGNLLGKRGQLSGNFIGQLAAKGIESKKSKRADLECTASETCFFVEFPLCVHSGTADFRNSFGATGNLKTGDFRIPDGQTGNLYTGPVPTPTGGYKNSRPTPTDDDAGATVTIPASLETETPTVTEDKDTIEKPTGAADDTETPTRTVDTIPTATGAADDGETPIGAAGDTKTPTDEEGTPLRSTRTGSPSAPSDAVFVGRAGKSGLGMGMWIVGTMLVANFLGYLGTKWI